MPFATLLLVTSTLAAPTAARPADERAGDLSRTSLAWFAPVSVAAQRPGPQASSPRPHQLGFGGSISASNGGAGGDVRYWFGDHLGLTMSAGWHRSGYETRTGQRASTVHASPSILYMFGRPNYTREVDIRPYFGGGASYVRSSMPVMSPSGAMLMSQASGTGMHTFGGAEVAFKEVEAMTFSGELVYYRLPVRLSNNAYDGFSYLIAVHFYVK
jgi:hypothetical protein